MEHLVGTVTNAVLRTFAGGLADLGEAARDTVDPGRIDAHFDAVSSVGDDTSDVEYADTLITRVILAPPHVKCKHCGTQYEVVLPHN